MRHKKTKTMKHDENEIKKTMIHDEKEKKNN